LEVLAQTPEQGDWLALLMFGGPVVLVLLLMSVVALAVTLYKLIQFRAYSPRSLRRLDEAVTLWCGGREEDALALADGSNSPVAPLIREGMGWLSRSNIDPATIEAELTRMAQQILTRLS
jgi:biopolymer transport protein ExbB